MAEPTDSESSLKIVYEAQLPLYWCERDEAELTTISLAQAGSVLQMLALTQEQTHEALDEETERSPDIARIEAKLDLLLNLLSHLVTGKAPVPETYQVRLGSQGITWHAGSAVAPKPGQAVWIEIHLDPQLPWPLRLPARVVSSQREEGDGAVQLIFEQLPLRLSEQLDKLIFRHHRRQVAQMRGKP